MLFFQVVSAGMPHRSINDSENSKLLKIGKIIDAHSLKGEVYLLFFAKDISWLNKGIPLLLEVPKKNSEQFEFKISSFRPFKEGALVKFEGVDNRNQSEELKGSLVFANDENFVSDPGETIYLREVLNFKIQNNDGLELGKIMAFNSNGIQDLLVVSKDNFSYEVPFVDDFIIEIQFEKKIVVMDFPADLMDINRVI